MGMDTSPHNRGFAIRVPVSFLCYILDNYIDFGSLIQFGFSALAVF
jgi:hypothetical protein